MISIKLVLVESMMRMENWRWYESFVAEQNM